MADHDLSRPVRAGGTLDLSTDRAPASTPEPPAPRPPVTPDPDVRVGKALDLSRRPAAPPAPRIADVLGHGPVVRETIDLSSHRPPAPAPPDAPRREPAQKRDSPPKQESPRRPAPPRPEPSRPPPPTPRGQAPKSASSSLADLLDPEVLARLRGG